MKKQSKQGHQEKMFLLIRTCKESGLSNKAFCEQEGIGQAMFYYWQKKLIESKQESPSGFFPVKVRNEAPLSKPIEIGYPNGVKLKLAEDTDLSVIRVLIGLV